MTLSPNNRNPQATPSPDASRDPSADSGPTPASEQTLKILQALWDTCNMARGKLNEPSQRQKADSLSREILIGVEVWRSGGLDAALKLGAGYFIAHVPKNVRNLASRALDVRALLEEQRKDSTRAYALAKLATGISASATEVVETLVRMTTNSLAQLPEPESATRQKYALDVLCRHLEAAFELQGTHVPSKLIIGKSSYRDRAIWALVETARFSSARGLALQFRGGEETEKIPAFERAATCAMNAVQIFNIASDIPALQLQVASGGGFKAGAFGMSERNVKDLTQLLLFAGQAFEHLGNPQHAAVALRAALWISPQHVDAREALKLLEHGFPAMTQSDLRASGSLPLRGQPLRNTRAEAPKVATSWIDQLSPEMDWELIRCAPPQQLGFELSRDVLGRLLEIKMKFGLERANALIPDSLLREVAHDVAVIEKLPAPVLPNYIKYVQLELKRQETSIAVFTNLLRMETCLQFVREIPGVESTVRQQAAFLSRQCEGAARRLHKPLDMGSAHPQILKAFHIFTECALARIRSTAAGS